MTPSSAPSHTDQRAREVLQAEIVRTVTEEETPWS